MVHQHGVGSNYGQSLGESIGRITPSGVVSSFTATGINAPEGITAGPDGALWFTNAANNSIGRITTDGAVSVYTGGPFLSVTPPDGPPGTTINLYGSGFSAGETVKVSYKTGLSLPKPPKVLLCTVVVATDGSFTCNATIPPKATAGRTDAHKIIAKGETSLDKATATFTA